MAGCGVLGFVFHGAVFCVFWGFRVLGGLCSRVVCLRFPVLSGLRNMVLGWFGILVWLVGCCVDCGLGGISGGLVCGISGVGLWWFLGILGFSGFRWFGL